MLLVFSLLATLVSATSPPCGSERSIDLSEGVFNFTATPGSFPNAIFMNAYAESSLSVRGTVIRYFRFANLDCRLDFFLRPGQYQSFINSLNGWNQVFTLTLPALVTPSAVIQRGLNTPFVIPVGHHAIAVQYTGCNTVFNEATTTNKTGPACDIDIDRAGLYRYNGFNNNDEPTKVTLPDLIFQFDSICPNFGVSTTFRNLIPGVPIEVVSEITNGAAAAALANRITVTAPSNFSCSWTCASTGNVTCPSASGSGNVVDFSSVLFPAASDKLTITHSCPSSLSATGSVQASSVVEASCSGNVNSTTVALLTPPALLDVVSVTNSNTVPGSPTTIVAKFKNNGPADAPATNVTGTMSSKLTNCAWTCVATLGACPVASGSGSFAFVNFAMVAGNELTVTSNCLIASNATGYSKSTFNIVSTTPDIGGSNLQNLKFLLTPRADKAVKMTVTGNVPGKSTRIVMTATNFGPSDAAPTESLKGSFPDEFDFCEWNCTGRLGAACASASGVGSIEQDISVFPAGGVIEFNVLCSIVPSALGAANVTFFFSGNGPTLDTDSSNNLVRETIVFAPEADMVLQFLDKGGLVSPGGEKRVEVLIMNNGSSDSPQSIFTLSEPPVGVLCELACEDINCPTINGLTAVSELAANKSVVVFLSCYTPCDAKPFTLSGTLASPIDNTPSNNAATIVVDFSAPLSITVAASPTKLACKGDKATLVATASGGDSEDYVYTLDNSLSAQPSSAFIVGGGDHTITVFDGNNCKATSSVITIEEPLTAVSVSLFDGVVDGCNTQLTAQATGGTGTNYRYSLRRGNTLASVVRTDNVFRLFDQEAGGVYVVDAYDENECKATSSGVLVPQRSSSTQLSGVSDINFCFDQFGCIVELTTTPDYRLCSTSVEEPDIDITLITPDDRKRNVESSSLSSSSSSSSSSSKYCSITDQIFVDGSLKKEYTNKPGRHTTTVKLSRTRTSSHTISLAHDESDCPNARQALSRTEGQTLVVAIAD